MEFTLKSFKKEISVTSLANIHYFELSPTLNTKGDSHSFCELVYVERGKIRISSDSYTGELTEGELIVHGPHERHSLSSDEAASPNIIIIGFECKSKSLDTLSHSPLRIGDELEKMLVEIVREGRAVYMPPYDIPNVKEMKKRRGFAFGADQLIKNYLQIFLIKCVRLSESIASGRGAVGSFGPEINLSLVSEVKEYIDCNFCQRILIEDLCFLFNTNKTTLARSFKAVYGQTVIDYVNSRRVKYTKKLLREGGHTLTSIAEMMDLSSVHYLTSLFKKHTGLSPTEYLASHTGEEKSKK
ncbi:MAG: helix-turn-helix domain-containing protein [Clostridia bacterium]|nr:helix-turn-helix domain-containing protein [Clostridia bacterium]